MNNKRLKIVAIAVLFFFSWTSAGMFQVAYAIDNLPQSSSNTDSSRTPKSEERFQKVIEEIEEVLENPAIDGETKASRVKAKRVEIEDLDIEIRRQFTETEKKLKDAGLPDEILQRHYKFIKHYDDNLKELKANLDAIEKTKGLAVEVEIEKTKRNLQRVKPPKKHTPLDPNKLPHRTPKVEKREPRLKKEDFEKDFLKPQKAEAQKKPILVASTGSLKGLLSQNSELITPNYLQIAQATNQPTPDDLAQNIEVQFTPEIIAKAQELGNNPVKIYNWVRNNIEFVPTYGSIQGAHMTLLTKQGNAFDTASLLIALLRVSNIPVRYVYGTIELPIDKVMNWVGGFIDANAALDFIASGGIPVTGIVSGGKVTKARMEHVWVETWVPYGNYRGTMIDQTIKTWIPMDGSFKQYTYTEPKEFASKIGFDVNDFINKIKSGAIINNEEGYVKGMDPSLVQQEMEIYKTRLEEYINTNFPNARPSEIIGSKKIINAENSILSSSHPYYLSKILNQFAEIPDTLRHKIEFKITEDYGSGGLSYTANLSEIAGKRVTLSYLPATKDDESIVKQYGGEIYNTPPYLINVKPVLRIDGEAKATGAAIGMSQQHEFFMKFITPWAIDEIRNNITVGQYLGIGLDATKVPQELIRDHLARMQTVIKQIESSQDVNIDDSLGELYYTTAMSYFAELDLITSISAQYHSIVSSRQPAEAIVGTKLDVSYLFSVPSSTSFTGSYIDVDRNISSICAKDNDPNKKLFFAQMTGFFASTMENIIFEQLYETPAISAVKLISLASQNGIPIYQINSTNIGNTLPQLGVSAEVKGDIRNAVSAGKIVTIPQNNLQHHDWIGTGYIITDPETGSAAYMISGGFAGGSTVFKTIWTIAEYVLTFINKTAAQAAAIIMTIYDIFASDASGAAKVCALLLLTIVVFLAVFAFFVSIPLVAFIALACLAALLTLCIAMILEYGKQERSKVFKLLQNYFAFLKVSLYFEGSHIPAGAII